MTRFRVPTKVLAQCLACCGAAALVAGLGFGASGTKHAPDGALGARSAHATRLLSHVGAAAGNDSARQIAAADRYRQFPLAFEPNHQQTDPSVKFLAHGEGYILFLTDTQAVFRMSSAPKSSSVLRMSLEGANAKPSFAGVDELPGKSNYFIGNKPENWHTNIPNYRKVAERGVYPGIDLVYYGTQRQLEYDFVVAPGADPGAIQLAFDGARNLHRDLDGNLILGGSANDVRLKKPTAYQQSGDKRTIVAANFALDKNGRVGLELGSYDKSLPLTIDPILEYSTYLGGSNIDISNAIAIAPDNTAFIAGSTFSADFPTLTTLQRNAGGGPDFPQDAFVAKISVDGSSLVYSTYLGGENRDLANGIAVDNFGNAYVIGTTLSPHYPVTTNAFNTLCGGDGECGASFNGGGFLVTNAFVTKLNIAGSALLYSTFFGEYENVSGNAIAVDSNFNAYLTGYTDDNFVPTVPIIPPKLPPPPFPISAGAFQTTYGGGATNVFVAKLDATGTTALYSSYLGGNVEDVGYGIALDSSANAIVTGLTYSTNFPTAGGPLQAAPGGNGDAFVTKVNPTGSAMIYSTYLGGSGLDQGNSVAIDPAGNAYVAGVTNSPAFGFVPAGFQPAYKGQGDAYVAKFTPAGALSYFTYLGGTKADSATGVAVDATGNAYVTGTTVSTDFPTAGAVFQPVYGGGNADSFAAKLDPAGKTLIYSSFLGGTNTELATGIAIDTSGSAYVTGQTCSQDFPLANALQAVPGGNCDAYVAKVSILAGFAINPAGLVFPAQSLHTTSASQTITILNGDNPQTISSIAIAGLNPGAFSQTNTCGASLGVGANCTITVTFAPTTAGVQKAALVITDSAPGSPQTVSLTGNTSTVTLSASSLAFGLQNVGTTSAAQGVLVTNSGTTPLAFSSIAASGDFAESDNCTKTPLQPQTTCNIAVTFQPTAPVASIGAITLTDNGSGSPQVILATGTGIFQPPTFQISSTTPTPAVSAGDAASYSLKIQSVSGFSQQVTLSCTAPATLSCIVSPSSVTPAANGSQTAQLTVSTALRTLAPPASHIRLQPPSSLRGLNLGWLAAFFAAMSALAAAAKRRRPLAASFGFAVVLLAVSVACSGGKTAGAPAGTAAGTYQVTVTGTSATTSSSTVVAIQVK